MPAMLSPSARGDEVAVAVPRLIMSSNIDDAGVALPGGHWHNVLTAQDIDGGPIPFETVRGDFPVAVLERIT